MNTEFLRQLLSESESTTLEFKRKLYDLDHSDSDTRKRQRDELIKDILALVNGSPFTVGKNAYLIIGADDKLQPDGARNLFDIDPASLTKQRILHLVNAACQPRLQDIECETVEVEGKRLLVITIWPTPHLHETTRDLTTSQGSFSKHTVFTRHDENIEVASQREREAILKLKQFHFADTRKAPPARFGAVVGGVVGGIMATVPPHKDNPYPKPTVIGRGVAGTILSSFLGLVIGWGYTNFLDVKYEWHFLSNRERASYVALYLGFVVSIWSFVRWIWKIMLAQAASENSNFPQGK